MKLVILNKDIQIEYKIHYMLYYICSLVCFPIVLLSQQIIIEGGVTDINGTVLSGAAVYLNDKYINVTDSAGTFHIRFSKGEQDTLKIFKDGFEVYTVKLPNHISEDKLIIKLHKLSVTISDVIIFSSFEEYKKMHSSLQSVIVQHDFLTGNLSGSLMQTLQKIPGIQSADIGQGMSKPVIRGLSYNRVVVAEYGVKIEGQHWSSHHGTALDQSRAKQIEIVKGPSTLKFGSDAIGGAVNIMHPKAPAEEGIAGVVSFVTRNNSTWKGLAGEISCKRGKIYTLLNASYNSFGDFKVPATDSFLLPAPVSAELASHKVVLGDRVLNTAGEQYGIAILTGFKNNKLNSSTGFSYFGNKTGFFDWEGMNYEVVRTKHKENYFDFLYPYQRIDHLSVIHQSILLLENNKIDFLLAYQLNSAREFNNLMDRTGNRKDAIQKYREQGNLDLQLDLSTFNLNANYIIRTIPKSKLDIGLNSQVQGQRKDGFNHILPAFQRISTGIFAIHSYIINEFTLLNAGVRMDHAILSVVGTANPDPDYGDPILNPDIKRNFTNLSFSAGLVLDARKDLILKVNLGKSYRVPSVYELAAYGLHRHEGRFEKGNPDLLPEQAYQLDYGMEKVWPGIKWTITPFFYYFSNYLYLAPTPALRPEGQVFEYMQNRAILTGTEISLHIGIGKFVGAEIGAEYLYAVNMDLRRALPATPPFYTVLDFYYRIQETRSFKNNKIGMDIIVAGRQNYTVPNELSTPGYMLLGMTASSGIFIGKTKLDVQLKIRNFTNKKYFNHISFYRRLRIPEPGRDLQLILKLPLNF